MFRAAAKSRAPELRSIRPIVVSRPDSELLLVLPYLFRERLDLKAYISAVIARGKPVVVRMLLA